MKSSIGRKIPGWSAQWPQKLWDIGQRTLEGVKTLYEKIISKYVDPIYSDLESQKIKAHLPNPKACSWGRETCKGWIPLHRTEHPWLWCSARVHLLGVPFACNTHNVQYLPPALGNLLQIHSVNDRSLDWSWYEQYTDNRLHCRRGPAKQGRSKSTPPSGQIIRNDCRNIAMLSCWVLMQWWVYPMSRVVYFRNSDIALKTYPYIWNIKP